MTTKNVKTTITNKQKIWLESLYNNHMNEVNASVASTAVYGEDFIYPDAKQLCTRTEVHIIKMDAVNAAFVARNLSKGLGVLCFGSYVSPGSGSTVEELLCTQSTLYPALESQYDRYYAKHKEDDGDDVIHSNCITIFSTPDVKSNSLLTDVFVASIRDLSKSQSAFVALTYMLRRMRKLYRLFNYTGCDTIIISDAGCTEFGYSAKEFANLWFTVVRDNPGLLRHVVFATEVAYDIYKELFEDYIVE